MRRYILILIIVLLSEPSEIQVANAQTFKWVDDKGTIHFTDDYSTIPEKYKENVKKENQWGENRSGQTLEEEISEIIQREEKEEERQREERIREKERKQEEIKKAGPQTESYDHDLINYYMSLCQERNYHLSRAREVFPYERNISKAFQMYYWRHMTDEERRRIPLTVTTTTDPCLILKNYGH